MNVGFVGLGSISDHYINVISNYIPNIIIRGVYDIDKTKRSVCDNLKNAKFYTNLRKMLKQENLDAAQSFDIETILFTSEDYASGLIEQKILNFLN